MEGELKDMFIVEDKLLNLYLNTETKPVKSEAFTLSRDIEISIEEEISAIVNGDDVIFLSMDGYIVVKRGFYEGMEIEMIDKTKEIEETKKKALYLEIPDGLNDERIFYLDRYNNFINEQENITRKTKGLKKTMNLLDEKPFDYNNHTSKLKSNTKKHEMQRCIHNKSFVIKPKSNIVYRYTPTKKLPIKVIFRKNVISVEQSVDKLALLSIKIELDEYVYDVDTTVNMGKTDFDTKNNVLSWNAINVKSGKYEMIFRELRLREKESDYVANVYFEYEMVDNNIVEVVGVKGSNKVFVKKVTKALRYETRCRSY